MNKQQAINLLKNLEQSLDDYCELNDEGKTAFRMAITALNCSEFPNSSDTISRQQAIDALEREKSLVERPITETRWFDFGLRKAQDVLSELPSAQPEQRWIPCSERLPKKERRTYWVCTDAGTQHECRWTNNRFGMTVSDKWGWSIFDTPQYTKVIAWMPLPEPYREDGQDENR